MPLEKKKKELEPVAGQPDEESVVQPAEEHVENRELKIQKEPSCAGAS